MASPMIITILPGLANRMPDVTGLAAVVADIFALTAMMIWRPEHKPCLSGWHPVPKAHHWHHHHLHDAPFGRAGQRGGSNI